MVTPIPALGNATVRSIKILNLRALRQPHARARAPMPLRLPRAAAAASLLLPHHHHRWFPHAPATQRVLVRVAWTKRRPRCTSHSPSPQARAAVACCICLLVLAALRCPRSPSAMTRNFARMRPLLPQLVKSQVKQGKRLIVRQGKAVPQVWGLGPASPHAPAAHLLTVPRPSKGFRV